jgi:transposase-like protein DUF772
MRDGRPSIPLERLLRALLLQAFFTLGSERQLMEQLVSSRFSKRAMLFVQPLGAGRVSRQWIDGFSKHLWQMWRSERKRSFATRRHRRFPQSNLVAKQAHNNGIRVEQI